MSRLLFESDEHILNDWIIQQNYSKLILLCDARTNGFCSYKVKKYLPSLTNSYQINIPAGEQHKQIETVDFVWQELLKIRADKKSLLINLGGGVVSDIGGFVAHSFKRGIDFINIPTTLLAMVDASIGGKNGINSNSIKNCIGTIYLPQYIYINTHFLSTLPYRETRSGCVETIKHAFIHHDPLFWQTIIQLPSLDELQQINFIQQSALIKKVIIEKDIYELNERQWLNYGHTIGHALESFSQHLAQPLLHGEAVLLGMIAETFISEKIFAIPNHYLVQLLNIYKKYFNDIKLNFDNKTILEFIMQDKKNKDGEIIMALRTITGMQSNCSIDITILVESLNFLSLHASEA